MRADEGIILVDKPLGWSSQKTVTRIKRQLGLAKAGHAGTLDPLATGLLIILADAATKRFAEFQQLKKEYVAEIELGRETDTGDAGGRVIRIYGGKIGWEEREIADEVKKLVGEQWQVPPVYSAVKVAGMTAYKRTLRGEKVELKPRKITVYEAEVLGTDTEKKLVKVRFVVSSGTYIRSLATELGKRRGCGAMVASLRRTQIGKWRVEEAEKIEDSDRRESGGGTGISGRDG